MRITLGILALAFLGCDSAPTATPTPAAPDEAASTNAGTTNAATPPATPAPEVFSGDGPVEFTEPVVILEADGLVVETQRWRTETTSGRAWRARATRAEVVARDEVGDFSLLEPGGDEPWAMINGGFYEPHPKGGYRAMGVVVADGTSHSPYRKRGGSGVFVVDAQGKASLVHRPDWKKVATTEPPHALQSIDRVVVEGASVVRQGRDSRGAARSAVAIDGQTIWLVAAAADDSTHELSPSSWRLSRTRRGMTLWEWSRFLIDSTGATHALNLDGGVSTQLVARAKGARVEVRGERGTLNAVVVKP